MGVTAVTPGPIVLATPELTPADHRVPSNTRRHGGWPSRRPYLPKCRGRGAVKKFASLVIVVAAVVSPTAGCADPPASGGGGTYTSIDSKHAIDVNAPINPYNGHGNAFQGYNAMQLAWPKNDLKDVNQF